MLLDNSRRARSPVLLRVISLSVVLRQGSVNCFQIAAGPRPTLPNQSQRRGIFVVRDRAPGSVRSDISSSLLYAARTEHSENGNRTVPQRCRAYGAAGFRRVGQSFPGADFLVSLSKESSAVVTDVAATWLPPDQCPVGCGE